MSGKQASASQGRALRILLRVFIVLAAAIVGFFVIGRLAGAFLIPPGAGLAGAAEAVLYGAAGALIAGAAGVALARLSGKVLPRISLAMALVLILTIVGAVWMVWGERANNVASPQPEPRAATDPSVGRAE